MASVTGRIKQIKQPPGGYLKPSKFEKENFTDGEILKEENIHATLIGLAVDYLTRLTLGISKQNVFKASLLGANNVNEQDKAYDLFESINGLDGFSIYSACKLVGYDACYRVGPSGYKNVDEIEADQDTIDNIRVMVHRSMSFFDRYGPITKAGFTLEGGYTDIINAGDGDFVTADTVWDFKVSKKNPTPDQTLQLLIYYIMGTHSNQAEFQSIQKIGIFNPRMNCVYLKCISDIPQSTINEVSRDVIGY